MQLKAIASLFESFAPLSYQENYDNSGLTIGSPETEINGILLAIDITEEVIDEALQLGANCIISHHPLLFSGLKKITGSNYTERCVAKAIQNNIVIYSAHTNIDSIAGGVNYKIAEKIGLTNCKILSPVKGDLRKLVVFVPTSHIEQVRQAIFNAGAGHIGNYDSCSFNITGKGTFKGNENSNPFVGEKNKLHIEEEYRIETIFPKHLQNNILKALFSAHPYEEVAFDIYPLENMHNNVGAGLIGSLPEPENDLKFLEKIKKTFHAECIRHTRLKNTNISKVALCGGSGSFLLNDALKQGADMFISADFKYHQFFDADNKIIIADIGHYESEQFTKEIFYDILIKNFPNFAVHFSGIKTNPIKYL